jgi:LysM repeat protein
MAKYTVTAPTKAKAIAQEAGTTAAEIRRLNDLKKGQTIEAGKTIRLGKGFSLPDDAAANPPAARVPNTDPSQALNDPIYQYYMNEALGDFRGQGTKERERLSNLYTDIYGETGQLKNFDVQAIQDQRRLAAEMAARGTLRSGAYAGGERGLGTQQQKQQASQRAGIEKGYNDQTSPQALFDMGLKRGTDGKVSELVQGEEISWTDPSSKEKKTMKYDWSQTTAGRQAKQAALQQWLQKQLAGVTSVM